MKRDVAMLRDIVALAIAPRAYLDALDRLTASIEELEGALHEISAVRLPTGPAGHDELHGCHQARRQMREIARAALAQSREPE